MKKIFIALGIATLIVVVQSFMNNVQAPADELKGPVHWYTFSEAVELQKKNPKPIIVDIYTSWCGPCKMMSKNTFGDEKIAKYLNQYYYPVKFNAETFDSVTFNGYTFKNKNAPGTNRPVHDFAISILDGKLVYPSIVFLNEQIQRIQVVTGYYQPAQFEPLMKFFGSGKYKEVKYEDFLKTFTPELQ
jgi:thioredoxin-related protein